MKPCIRCKEAKPLDDFYAHKQMADGHLNKCKDCCRKDALANRHKNIEYYREYDRKRSDLEHRAEARKLYAKTDWGKATQRAGAARWRARNPRKVAAQLLFNNRQRSDKSLAEKPCEECGREDMVHAHHENYDEPLKVRWLCPKHHSERHKEMRRLGIVP